MSQLSPTERAGCAELLRLMSKSDLLSLCDTVTNKAIVVQDATDAIEAILSFSKNAEELLKRRRVHRDLIFKYLYLAGVAMLPDTDKQQLLTRCLEIWTRRPEIHCTESRKHGCESEAVARGCGFDPMSLGSKFCVWFYQILNSHNPELKTQKQEFGPQHFWSDATMQLLTRVRGEHVQDFKGSELISCRLLALTKDEMLVFSPNLETPGLKTLVSPHGLVLVAVAGTVHRGRACLGVFEQIFGLIRSPLDNNSFKIKFVKLKICEHDSVTRAEAPALTYDLHDLQLMCSQ